MGRIVQEFREIAYEDFERDDVFRATYDLAPSLVAEYDRLIGSSGGRGDVPPWVFCTFLPMFRGMGGRMEQGSIHTRQSMTVFRSAATGAKLDVEIRVADKYERAGRRHVVLEIVFSDGHGPVCTSTGTFLWGYATR
jgi:hypothetical protein